MSYPLPDDRYFTYADYATWPEGVRYELIEGAAFLMSPGPAQAHQETLGALHAQLYNYLRGKSCKVFAAPFDVRLNADTEDDTVLQPDLLVVCDASKLNGKHCLGAPDLVIEILSPSSVQYDRVVKLRLYQNAGVREYWVVDPALRTAETHILTDGEYAARVYGAEDTVPVHVLDACEITLKDVFGAIDS
ncbi:MAG: Uma2 family endonuclease [Oscillospiraceae bacterium]|jgi:Uma2 family endonuclease|nr:Uma2 family endonuclease [Oscillospiraceae bacterium]